MTLQKNTFPLVQIEEKIVWFCIG